MIEWRELVYTAGLWFIFALQEVRLKACKAPVLNLSNPLNCCCERPNNKEVLCPLIVYLESILNGRYCISLAMFLQ